MDTQILIILYLTVLRYMVLTYYPQVVFSGYAYMFGIAFAISYGTLHNLKASLTISLLVVIGRVVYRYTQKKEELEHTTGLKNTAMFMAGLGVVFVASNFLEPYKNSLYVDYALYATTSYCIGSVMEWVIHRNIMHCYQSAPWILNSPIKSVCLEHKNHHLSVKKDMTLREPSRDDDLVFNIETTSIFVILFFIITRFVVYILDIKGIGIYTHATVSVLFMFLVSMIWNSVHTKMHAKDVYVPFIPKIDTPESMYNVYLTNHELHHKIKGEDKGNFNVVLLGADEIMDTNNKEQ
jgi:hypothetical protein